MIYIEYIENKSSSRDRVRRALLVHVDESVSAWAKLCADRTILEEEKKSQIKNSR